MKKATAATNTASQLMSEKIAVLIKVGFVRRTPSEVITRKDKSFFRIDKQKGDLKKSAFPDFYISKPHATLMILQAYFAFFK